MSGISLAEFVVNFDRLVCLNDKEGNDGSKAKNCDKTSDKSCAECTCGDKGSDLVYEETDGISGSKLESDSSPEPLLTLHLGVHCTECCEAGRSVEME